MGLDNTKRFINIILLKTRNREEKERTVGGVGEETIQGQEHTS